MSNHNSSHVKSDNQLSPVSACTPHMYMYTGREEDRRFKRPVTDFYTPVYENAKGLDEAPSSGDVTWLSWYLTSQRMTGIRGYVDISAGRRLLAYCWLVSTGGVGPASVAIKREGAPDRATFTPN